MFEIIGVGCQLPVIAFVFFSLVTPTCTL